MPLKPQPITTLAVIFNIVVIDDYFFMIVVLPSQKADYLVDVSQGRGCSASIPVANLTAFLVHSITSRFGENSYFGLPRLIIHSSNLQQNLRSKYIILRFS